MDVGQTWYVRVQRPGGARTIALGRVIPEHWSMVAVTLVAADDTSVTLTLEPVEHEYITATSATGRG